MDERTDRIDIGRSYRWDDRSGPSRWDYLQGRDSEEIKREIDRTRAQMNGTIAALQDRMSVRNMASRVVDVFTEGSTRQGSLRAMEAVRDNPVPAALIGLGVMWLMADRRGGGDRAEVGRGRRGDWLARGASYTPRDAPWYKRFGIGRGRERSAGFMERARGRVSEAAEHVTGRASGFASGTRDVLHKVREFGVGAKDRFADTGHTIRERAGQFRETVGEGAGRLRERTVDTYDENPLALGAAAMALGLVGGLLIPSTRGENEFMGGARDEILNRAKGFGYEAAAAGTNIGGRVVGAVREEVRAQNIGKGIDTGKSEFRAKTEGTLGQGGTAPDNA